MGKVPILYPSEIQQIANKRQLVYLTMETGNENAFIQNENKFIVTKDFLGNSRNVFSHLNTVEVISFKNFDFSQISTMDSWFYFSENLQEIIFPNIVECPILRNLKLCFAGTKLKELDLSNWKFSTYRHIILDGLISFSLYIEYLNLPNISIQSFNKIALNARRLKNIDFNKSSFDLHNDHLQRNFLESFFGCHKLKEINCSKMILDRVQCQALKNNFDRSFQKPRSCKLLLPQSRNFLHKIKLNPIRSR